MNKSRSMLAAFVTAQFLVFRTALAGMPEAAGTLLSEQGTSRNETLIVLALAVLAVAVVIYLRRRKSK